MKKGTPKEAKKKRGCIDPIFRARIESKQKVVKLFILLLKVIYICDNHNLSRHWSENITNSLVSPLFELFYILS
jgi:hypothetical protein